MIRSLNPGLLALLLATAKIANAQDGGVAWRPMPGGQFVLGCADEKATKKKPAPTRMPALWVMPRRVSVGEYRGLRRADWQGNAVGFRCVRSAAPSAP